MKDAESRRILRNANEQQQCAYGGRTQARKRASHGRSLNLTSTGYELATGHFEASQKLNIALRACNAALPDAGLPVRRAKLRPAFVELIPGICFVFRAVGNFFGADVCHFRIAVSDNIEGGYSVGGPGL